MGVEDERRERGEIEGVGSEVGEEGGRVSRASLRGRKGEGGGGGVEGELEVEGIVDEAEEVA